MQRHDEHTRMQAAYRLGKIGTGNEGAIQALLELLKTTQNEYTRWLAANSLRKIGTGNEGAIQALLELLKTTH